MRTVGWPLLFLIGLGGLFAGVTGPLISTFLPPMVRDALGDQRLAIGAIMAIDNVLLLLLVPWAGAASDRASARGAGRVPLVLAGFVLAAAGMALFPASSRFGIAGIVAATVVLYVGIHLQRSPFQALLADVVPAPDRPLATGSVTFQMCAGGIVFLLVGRALGMAPAFLMAAVAVLAIAAAFALGLRETQRSALHAAETSFMSIVWAARTVMLGLLPGMRAIFITSLLLQLTFQTFTTWFALHGTERFAVRPEDVAIGFIAWAVGGAVGALPAGFIGMRIGRRNAMLLGLASMTAWLAALHGVTRASDATLLIALASASWTLPAVNAYPLFVEPIPPARRGVLAALFLLSMALGGAIGDPLNGGVFDLYGGYRPMFLLMAGYTALAFVAVLFVPPEERVVPVR